jgi:hypothetical protein
MTVLGEALIVALAVVAGVGGVVAVLYLLWLILLDVRHTAGRASGPEIRVVHVLHHVKRS